MSNLVVAVIPNQCPCASNATCHVNRSDRERLEMERDQLMKKLVEVEMDGQAAVKQTAALRDSIRRLREVSTLHRHGEVHPPYAGCIQA